MKIFLIEDDKALANLISATIEKYGFDVISASLGI